MFRAASDLLGAAERAAGFVKQKFTSILRILTGYATLEEVGAAGGAGARGFEGLSVFSGVKSHRVGRTRPWNEFET